MNKGVCNFFRYEQVARAANMRYLDAEFEKYGWRYTKYGPMINLTSNNRVAAELKEHGYKIVHFATNWCATRESDNADVTYTLEPNFLQREFLGVLRQELLEWLTHGDRGVNSWIATCAIRANRDQILVLTIGGE